MVEQKRLKDLLNKFPETCVTVIGDMAVDGYWNVDMKRSELSRETPFFNKPVLTEQYSLGAGANVAANLKSLGCGTVYTVSVIGTDWRGDVLLEKCAEKSIDSSCMLRSTQRTTTAFIKPILRGYKGAVRVEDSRFDFENTERPAAIDEETVIKNAKKAIEKSNAVIICDQVNMGMMSESMIKALINLSAEYEDIPFIADSRYRISDFDNMILKPNEIEACSAAGIEFKNEESILKAGRELASRGPCVFITAGEKGVYVFTDKEYHQPGFVQEEPVDIVGAGDTCIAALAAVLSAGGTDKEAAFTACLASSVTVKKLNTTGTVLLEELIARYDEIH